MYLPEKLLQFKVLIKSVLHFLTFELLVKFIDSQLFIILHRNTYYVSLCLRMNTILLCQMGIENFKQEKQWIKLSEDN